MLLDTGGRLVGVDSEQEPSLVRDCAGGDDAAWRLLHLRYYPIAAAFLRKLGVLPQELEDASQEVFLEMHRYLPRFRGDAELKTWLYRLCITQARLARRRRRMRQTLRAFLARAPVETLISAPGFCEHAARQRIEVALSQLSESQRTVFVLLDMEGVSSKEAAEIVGCRETSIWRRLHDARQRFVRALGSTTVEQC